MPRIKKLEPIENGVNIETLETGGKVEVNLKRILACFTVTPDKDPRKVLHCVKVQRVGDCLRYTATCGRRALILESQMKPEESEQCTLRDLEYALIHKDSIPQIKLALKYIRTMSDFTLSWESKGTNASLQLQENAPKYPVVLIDGNYPNIEKALQRPEGCEPWHCKTEGSLAFNPELMSVEMIQKALEGLNHSARMTGGFGRENDARWVALYGGGSHTIGTGKMRSTSLAPMEIDVWQDSPLGMERYWLAVMPCKVHSEEESAEDESED